MHRTPYFTVLSKFKRSNHFCSPWHRVLIVSYGDRSFLDAYRRVSSDVCQHFHFNVSSSETAHMILSKLHRNDTYVPPTIFVQTISIGCMSSSHSNKIRFKTFFLSVAKVGHGNKNRFIIANFRHSSRNNKTQKCYISYMTLCIGSRQNGSNDAYGTKSSKWVTHLN